MPANCCVAGCNNRQRNSKMPFYNIPRGRTPFERNRRQLWLKAIPRDKWSSKTLANARICGAHFVSGKRSDDITAPNFVPTIFPAVPETVNSSSEEKKSGPALDNEDGIKDEVEDVETGKGLQDGDAAEVDGLNENSNNNAHSQVKPEQDVEMEKSNEASQCQHAGCNLAAEVRSDLRRKFRRKSHDEQSNYLVSCMRLRDSKFTYGVRVGDEILPACLAALSDTFGQSLTRLRLLGEKLTKGVSVAAIRGKRRNGRKEKRCPVKVQAREHIGSFPLYESHFGRGVYLNPMLSTRTMHSLYARKFPPMTIKYYRNVFGSEFELGFGQPRSDSCRTCDELFAELQAARTEEEMSEVAVRSVVHHYREDETYRVVAEDVETAKRDPDVMVVCGDLQQALLAPQLTQCPTEFYRRQLSCYNYGFHDGASGKATMMLWDETVAKRGTAEIASCLLKYVASNAGPQLGPDRRRRLVFWCDCRVGGHGGNWRLARALAHLLREGLFASAEVKFLRTGHSFLPCDRDFALIEKRRRVSPVAVPTDWAQVIGSDNRSKRLEVVTMQRADFKDFGEVEGFLKEPEAARIDAAAWIRLTAKEPAVVRVRETHGSAEPWKCFATVQGGAEGKGLPEAYSERLGIDKDKLSDLLDMCEYLTPQQAEFYRSLKAVEEG